MLLKTNRPAAVKRAQKEMVILPPHFRTMECPQLCARIRCEEEKVSKTVDYVKRQSRSIIPLEAWCCPQWEINCWLLSRKKGTT
jgi:hypothetical protein